MRVSLVSGAKRIVEDEMNMSMMSDSRERGCERVIIFDSAASISNVKTMISSNSQGTQIDGKE